MKKVYCSNCRYYFCNDGGRFYYSYTPTEHNCYHPANIKKCDNAIAPYMELKETANIKNNNNNCLFYIKKWYKFWVK